MTPPRRRWFRFSLRTLFVVLTVFCVWLGVQVKWRNDRRAELQWLQDVDATYIFSSAWKDASQTDMVVEGSGVMPLGYVTGPPSTPWGLRVIGERGVSTIVLLRKGDSEESINLTKRRLARLFPEAKIWVGSNPAECRIW